MGSVFPNVWCRVFASAGLLGALLASAGPAVASMDASDQAGTSPVSVDFAYIGEAWRNTTGGLRTGSAYIDHLSLGITVDGEVLLVGCNN